VKSTDDGVFVFTRPDGQRIPECGPRPMDYSTAIEGMQDRERGVWVNDG
jgi:hypothetical protein